MKTFESTELKEAYKAAGFRERYAMENGKKTITTIRGHKCYKFTYPETHEYQDANGAAYDTITKAWIN